MGKTQTVTIMFCDLVASTERRARLGDDAFDEFSERFIATLRDQIDRSGGRELTNLGDGLMAVWTESTADAVACATAMHRTVAGLDSADPPRLRVGISSGEVAQVGDEYSGMPIVEAARLEAAASPGRTLANAVVAHALVGTRARSEVPGRGRPLAQGDTRPPGDRGGDRRRGTGCLAVAALAVACLGVAALVVACLAVAATRGTGRRRPRHLEPTGGPGAAPAPLAGAAVRSPSRTSPSWWPTWSRPPASRPRPPMTSGGATSPSCARRSPRRLARRSRAWAPASWSCSPRRRRPSRVPSPCSRASSARVVASGTPRVSGWG